MRRADKVLLGAVAVALGALAGSQGLRRRRGIDFEGRVVVITGGSRGLGLVMARQLAAQGAKLCLLARDAAELQRAEEQLTGADVLPLVCDIRNKEDVQRAIDAVLQRWTAVDVLINNAGIVQVGPLEHMTLDDFENAMATHFWGPLYLMMAVVPAMRRRGFGRIVNISSIGGRVAVPHLGPYCASKFALVGLSDSVRSELAGHGIRVTTVSPGLMRTGSPLNAFMKGDHEAEYAWFAISDSVPVLSTSAEHAARRILEACRYGDAELTLTIPAKAAVKANAVMPSVVAAMMALANQLLPRPAGPEGDRNRRGRDSTSKWAPSIATTLTDRAAVANNEI